MAGIKNNPVYKMVATTLSDAGVAHHEVEHRGKHMAVVWYHGGLRRQLFLPNSPSDVRAPLNARGNVRRMLRQDGLSA